MKLSLFAFLLPVLALHYPHSLTRSRSPSPLNFARDLALHHVRNAGFGPTPGQCGNQVSLAGHAVFVRREACEDPVLALHAHRFEICWTLVMPSCAACCFLVGCAGQREWVMQSHRETSGRASSSEIRRDPACACVCLCARGVLSLYLSLALCVSCPLLAGSREQRNKQTAEDQRQKDQSQKKKVTPAPGTNKTRRCFVHRR